MSGIRRPPVPSAMKPGVELCFTAQSYHKVYGKSRVYFRLPGRESAVFGWGVNPEAGGGLSIFPCKARLNNLDWVRQEAGRADPGFV